MTDRNRLAPLIVIVLAAAAWASPRSQALDGPKTQGTVRVDFESQVKPILEARCLKCHSRGKYKGSLSLETREAVIRGGEEGPAVIVGKSDESLLVKLVAGLDPDRRMPDRGDPLPLAEVMLLRSWIDQGLVWPEGLSFGFRRAPIEPRKPAIPQAPGGLPLVHPIDRFVARYLADHGIEVDWTPVPDRLFARRASLDLIGLLPSPAQLEAFETDRRPDKGTRLVESLLADRRAYADHWLSFWNDALRNAYRGTGFIDGGRQSITQWLYLSLYENKPYDRFVHELVSPVPGSEGFAKGIVWRGVVNASQAPPVQAAQNVSQVFLGTNLKCASCHDSFVNSWKLTEAYALASIFAEKPLELHRCDKPTGRTSSIAFIYPQLGTIDAGAPRLERMKQLADTLVKPANGRFGRTIVNRLWARLMGRGIVEPLDDMDQPAWSQDLLDALADDFVVHGHDLKHTLALVCTSRAYRLPSVGVSDPSDRGPFRFRGPLAKRMTGEQFDDAVSTVTGVWPQATGEMLKVDGRGQGGQIVAVRSAIAAAEKTGQGSQPAAPRVEAQWVWSHADAENDPGGRVLFRKVVRLDEPPDRALAVATCDNELVLYVNGRQVAQSSDWTKPVSVDLTKLLKAGENVIAVEATNWPDEKHRRGIDVRSPNPAALIAWVGGFKDSRQVWGIGTDETWLWNEQAEGDWKNLPYDTAGWRHTVALSTGGRLYGATVDLVALVARSLSGGDAIPIRAALAFDDPLLAALGRTNREQVVTRRDDVATTLQALELTNGVTLDEKLKQAARRWIEQAGRDPDALIRRVFLTAFGRGPVPEERSAAAELLGDPASPEGVQDLLWALLMLPEFQLIE
jgi:hypothetical protein